MAFLLDTNVCIDFALGRSLRLLERMQRAVPGTLAMSAITYAELSVGARGGDLDADLRRLQALTRFVPVRPFDDGAGQSYGTLVRAVGVRRNSFDNLIAAHALALGLTLITNNERDFADVPGLRVENWTR